MGILKNPRDKIRKFIFKKLCQEDFAIGPLLRVDFGKIYFFKKVLFADQSPLKRTQLVSLLSQNPSDKVF